MSRIGKKPIEITEGATVTVSGNSVSVKGPVGEISRELDPRLGATVSDGKVLITVKTADSRTSALSGTYVSHITNMIAGATKPFEKRLILEGIGFKADVKGGEMIMSLGFSHPVAIKIPAGLKVVSDKNGISISGIDIEAVGQFAAKVRSCRLPEPYKGKGFHYSDEVIRRKQGKKTT
jgi:large subunit ribosomal protein L6